MTHIRCRDRRCVFDKNGICTSDEIEYEPDAGCLTMELREGLENEEEEWEDEEETKEDSEEFEDEDEDEEEEEDEDWENGKEDEYLSGRRRRR